MKTQEALQAALDDLQRRAVVEATVRSMLVDVELAVSLEKDLVAEETHRNLQQRALASELALLEARQVTKQDDQYRATLADDLVKELWSLSQELGNLKRWKRENEDTIQERDQLVAKLLQAEEQIEILRSMPMAPPDGDAKPAARSHPEPTLEPKLVHMAMDVPKPSSTEMSEDAIEALEDLPTVATASADSTEVAQMEHASPVLAQAMPPQGPVVSLLLEEEDGDAPQLPTLDESILLNVFSFLDAVEIVQLAQVSIGLYSRVDSLFVKSGDDAEPPSIPAEIATSIPPPQPQATVVQLPPTPPSTKPVLAALPETKPAAGGVLSLFQTSKKPALSFDAKPKDAAASKQPLSVDMANSMAQKLSDKEINAIISMTNKLSKRNEEVEMLNKTNLELRGKLDGTEAIKAFLVNKVREVEQTLQKSKELERKTAHQIASDQEVIAFLDSRVQELEIKEQSLTAEKKSISDQRISEQLRNEKKITILSDMLQYERERSAENERDWKATRKVLVKEIKSCRGHIMALQAERDGLQEQNERLKRAVMATGATNGSPMREDRV